MDYTGIYHMNFVEESDLARFYQGEFQLEERLKENQYLIVEQNDEPIDYYKKKNGKLEKVQFPTITNRYEASSIKPKNPEQYCAMDLLHDETSKVKILRGVYGSGRIFATL